MQTQPKNNQPIQSDKVSQDFIEPYRNSLKDYFPTREALVREAQMLTQKTLARRKRQLKNAALMSIACLALISTWLLDPVLKTDTFNTMVGEQMTYTLLDGSVVTLNTNSQLKVSQHLRSRRLELLQGEALFNVVHAWRSFTVQANDTLIRDIGTVFNVRNYADGAVVTVLEGAVEVGVNDGHQKQTLVKNQSLHAYEGGEFTPQTVDATNISAWQKGLIFFDGTTLDEAVKEIARYRKAPILIADKAAAKLRISGAYDITGIESLIDTLPISVAVNIERKKDDTIEIHSR